MPRSKSKSTEEHTEGTFEVVAPRLKKVGELTEAEFEALKTLQRSLPPVEFDRVFKAVHQTHKVEVWVTKLSSVAVNIRRGYEGGRFALAALGMEDELNELILSRARAKMDELLRLGQDQDEQQAQEVPPIEPASEPDRAEPDLAWAGPLFASSQDPYDDLTPEQKDEAYSRATRRYFKRYPEGVPFVEFKDKDEFIRAASRRILLGLSDEEIEELARTSWAAKNPDVPWTQAPARLQVGYISGATKRILSQRATQRLDTAIQQAPA